jgi:hypothetical protein
LTIISLLVTLVIIGVLLYVLNAVVPMDPKIKTIVNAIVIVLVLLWLLEVFGLVGPWHLGSGRIR